MHREQRRHPRVDIRVGAEVQTADMEVTCGTKNVSLGGVALELDRSLPEGRPAMVTLFVVVDDIEDLATRPVEVPGTVVWCRQTGPERFEAGIRFESPDGQTRDYLQRLVTAATQ